MVKMVELVTILQQRIVFLLNECDDHPALQKIVDVIEMILAIPLSTPLAEGIEKKTAKLQGIEKAVVAHHEAGHAVVGTAVAKLLFGQPRVEKLSILPRSGGALGFTYTPPTSEDRYLLFVNRCT